MKDSKTRVQNSDTFRYGNTTDSNLQSGVNTNQVTQKRNTNSPSGISASQIAQLRLQESENTVQLKGDALSRFHALKDGQATATKQANSTGLPDNLKSGIENLSGYSMDDVKVHYNSDKPSSLQAHAYAQGTNIHVAPGQEQHLPHEAWHVAQQKQGRVQAGIQMKSGIKINDDTGLEKEADVMGQKAMTATVTDTPVQLKTNSSSNEIIQGKIKANNFRKLIEEQDQLQKDVKENPQNYKGQYTTVGFEHEFAQMTNGPLQGISHLEVAKSEEKMPLTNMPFVLETDAQNALELVTPPFLIETINGKPIPEPDEIEKVDGIIKNSLTKKIQDNTNLNDLVNKFASSNKLTFPLKKLQIKRENITPRTKDEIYNKGIGRNHATVSKDDLGTIPLELSKKGGNGNVHISTHVNFATDADTYDKMQDLYSKKQMNDDEARGYIEVQNGLKEVMFRKLFKQEAKRAKKDKVRENLLKGLDDICNPIYEQLNGLDIIAQKEIAAKVPYVERKYNIKPILLFKKDVESIYNKTITKLNLHALTPAGIQLCLTEFEEGIKGIKDSLRIRFDNLNNCATEKKINKAKFLEIGTEMAELKEYAKQITIISGTENPNLKVFINSLARTLSGLYAVPAMEKVRKAQKKRLEDPDKGMNVEDATTKLSRVKDINQVWIKDTITNIGLGILKPADWQTVYDMTTDSVLIASLKTIESPIFDNQNEDSKDEFNLLLEQALITLQKNIKDQKLNKTDSDGNPKTDTSKLYLSPKEQPELFTHKSKHIGPRQDTFIPGKKVQMPEIWEGKRLHVVESRKDTVEVLRELKELHTESHSKEESTDDNSIITDEVKVKDNILIEIKDDDLPQKKKKKKKELKDSSD